MMTVLPTISRASRVFGLPSTIRTYDLGLRSFNNETKQQQKIVLRCWLLVFSTHRDLWDWVELVESWVGSAGGQMI
jgi:hypothetical protein